MKTTNAEKLIEGLENLIAAAKAADRDAREFILDLPADDEHEEEFMELSKLVWQYNFFGTNQFKELVEVLKKYETSKEVKETKTE